MNISICNTFPDARNFMNNVLTYTLNFKNSKEMIYTVAMSEDQFTRLFKYIEKRFDAVDARFDEHDKRFDDLTTLIDGYASHLDTYAQEMAALTTKSIA